MDKKNKFIIIGVLAALVLIGVGKKWTELPREVPAPTEAAPPADPKGGPPNAAPANLQKTDIKVGTGKEAKNGDQVTVNYRGSLPSGTIFDQSYGKAEPFKFVLGQGQVIKGWDLGVAGMKEGGKRKLVIPSELGYGAAGAGDKIPPNSTLIFEIELLKVG